MKIILPLILSLLISFCCFSDEDNPWRKYTDFETKLIILSSPKVDVKSSNLDRLENSVLILQVENHQYAISKMNLILPNPNSPFYD